MVTCQTTPTQSSRATTALPRRAVHHGAAGGTGRAAARWNTAASSTVGPKSSGSRSMLLPTGEGTAQVRAVPSA